MIAIHYGNQTQLNCSTCKHVFYFKGPKFRLIWRATQTRKWQEEIAPFYDAVMLGDDDLQMTTCTINRCTHCLQLVPSPPPLPALPSASCVLQ